MHTDENGVEAERMPREDQSMQGRGAMQLTALPVFDWMDNRGGALSFCWHLRYKGKIPCGIKAHLSLQYTTFYIKMKIATVSYTLPCIQRLTLHRDPQTLSDCASFGVCASVKISGHMMRLGHVHMLRAQKHLILKNFHWNEPGAILKKQT